MIHDCRRSNLVRHYTMIDDLDQLVPGNSYILVHDCLTEVEIDYFTFSGFYNTGIDGITCKFTDMRLAYPEPVVPFYLSPQYCGLALDVNDTRRLVRMFDHTPALVKRLQEIGHDYSHVRRFCNFDAIDRDNLRYREQAEAATLQTYIAHFQSQEARGKLQSNKFN